MKSRRSTVLDEGRGGWIFGSIEVAANFQCRLAIYISTTSASALKVYRVRVYETETAQVFRIIKTKPAMNPATTIDEGKDETHGVAGPRVPALSIRCEREIMTSARLRT